MPVDGADQQKCDEYDVGLRLATRAIHQPYPGHELNNLFHK